MVDSFLSHNEKGAKESFSPKHNSSFPSDNQMKYTQGSKCKNLQMKARLESNHLIRMKPSSNSSSQFATNDISQKLNSAKGVGNHLPHQIGAEMSSKIGPDFSEVKVHTDSNAVQMSRELGAKAFTHGDDIYFNSGQYNPSSAEGKHLLAHELTHVIQQGPQGRVSPMIQREMVSDRDGTLVFDTRDEAQRRLNNIIRIVPDPELEGNFLLEWRWNPTNPAEDPWTRGTRSRTRVLSERRLGELVRIAGEEGRWYVEKDTELRPDEPATTTSPPRSTSTSEEESESSPESKVCLTFDDGPKAATPGVLDELSSEGILATFFLTGGNMRDTANQEALVRRMLTAGHRIANHVFTHSPTTADEYRSAYPSLIDPTTPDSPAEARRFNENFTSNESHFRSLLGTDFPGFDVARLPGDGRTFPELVAATERLGMRHVGWDFEFGNSSIGWLRARNWQGITGVRATYARLPSGNDIILFHDAHWSGIFRASFAQILRKLKRHFSFGLIDSNGRCS
ncbi:MAG: DUF4157 domain-containing protein [Fulvivirga sp.]